ncbi:unnamed protein product [Amoebophrya sp. A120]|nr:unnamed protein product [Amoebophrya sp. A120]|eukprot:GSA120T00017403001.1
MVQKPFLLQYHSRPLTCVRFNRDGDFFISSANDGRCCLIRTETGERIGTYEGHDGAIKSCDIDAESSMVVTAGADSRVVFYDAQTGDVIYSLNHGGIVKSVEFNQHPECQDRIVTCADKFKTTPNNISIWQFDFTTDDPVCERVLMLAEELPMKATMVKWGPFDETLISIHEEGTFCVWDISNAQLIKLVEAHQQPIKSLNFNENRTLLLTASRDKTVKMWETQEYSCLKKFQSNRPFNDAVLSPLYTDPVNPRYHVLAGGGVEAREVTQTTEGGFESVLFNMVLEEEIGTIKGHFGPMNTIAISPDGRSYVTGGEEGLIRLIHFDPDYFTRKDL